MLSWFGSDGGRGTIGDDAMAIIIKNLKRVMVRDGICVSNSFYVVFYPILAPIPNFIQIGRKIQKLKIFSIGLFWLVGLVGRKMDEGISNSFYVVFVLVAQLTKTVQVIENFQLLYFSSDLYEIWYRG